MGGGRGGALLVTVDVRQLGTVVVSVKSRYCKQTVDEWYNLQYRRF